MISRRRFLGQSTVAMAGISAFGLGAAAGGLKTRRELRVIAYNVYKCNGWPKDNQRTQKARSTGQIPARLAQELALYEPGIINFSESPEEPVVQEIAGLLDMNYAFFPSGGNWPGALLTRFEILDSANVPLTAGERPGDLFTRHWGKATVRLSGGEQIAVHSAHLYPHDNPEAREIRQREIPEILKAAQDDISAGRSALILGDLNHTPSMPEYRLWTDAGWTDTFAAAGKGAGLTIRADEPTRRIDYVLAAGTVAKQVLESRPLFEGAFRTNPGDPGSFALSDHLPQMAVFGNR